MTFLVIILLHVPLSVSTASLPMHKFLHLDPSSYSLLCRPEVHLDQIQPLRKNLDRLKHFYVSLAAGVQLHPLQPPAPWLRLWSVMCSELNTMSNVDGL